MNDELERELQGDVFAETVNSGLNLHGRARCTGSWLMTRSMIVALASLAMPMFSACSEDASPQMRPATGVVDATTPGVSDAGRVSGGEAIGTTGTTVGQAGASDAGAPSIDASGASPSRPDAATAAGPGPDGGAQDGGAAGTTGMGASSEGGAPAPMPGNCVGDWKAGTYPPDFITTGDALADNVSLPAIGGYDYAVHVPKGYDCRLPTPIVFGLHGLGMNGWSFNVAGTSTPKRKGGLVAKADESGFILVMPTGMSPSADAVQAVREIFKNLETHLNIDHKRVYATGHSFGGSLSYLLACTAADLFTAVAPNAWTMPPSPCNPAKPISVLASGGDQDGIAPGGGDVTPAIKVFAAANGCSATSMPATVPANGPDTTCVTHPGCKGGVEVTGCVIKGGGHVWFGDSTCGTGVDDSCWIVGENSDYYVNTDFAWDFLKRFSR